MEASTQKLLSERIPSTSLRDEKISPPTSELKERLTQTAELYEPDGGRLTPTRGEESTSTDTVGKKSTPTSEDRSTLTNELEETPSLAVDSGSTIGDRSTSASDEWSTPTDTIGKRSTPAIDSNETNGTNPDYTTKFASEGGFYAFGGGKHTETADLWALPMAKHTLWADGLMNQMEHAAVTSLCDRTGVHFGGTLQNAHTHNAPPLAGAKRLCNGRNFPCNLPTNTKSNKLSDPKLIYPQQRGI